MSNITDAAIKQALQAVIDPNTGRDFVSTRQLKNLRVTGSDVAFDVELGIPPPARSTACAAR